MRRRDFCTDSLAAALMLASGGYGLLAPRRARAGGDPGAAFGAGSEAQVVEALFGRVEPEPTDAIEIDAPIQGNGDPVPVMVTTGLEGISAIAITVAGNPHPLSALVLPHRAATGPYGTRVSMAKTSHVSAYVEAQGRVYVARRLVKVSIGGSGTGR